MAGIKFVNMQEFAFKLDASVVGGSIEVAMAMVRRLALSIYTNTILKTPVDTGMLRNSWLIGVNQDPEGVGSAGAAGAAASAVAMASMVGVLPGDSIIIINNVEYAVYVEEGSDRNAPRAMLRRSIEEAVGGA